MNTYDTASTSPQFDRPEDAPPAPLRELPWDTVKFHGSGGQYFKIWIVNLLLTLLTLGIYSAWATVRERRYLYGCTEVAGSRFDFHGKPLQILLGRVIAIVLLIAWTQGHLIHFGVQLAAMAIVICLFPWFMVKAMRFKLKNTSFRNLRFDFRGSPVGAYKVLGRYLAYTALLMGTMVGATMLTFSGLDPEAMSQPAGFQSIAVFILVYLLVMLAYTFLYPAFVCDMRSYTLNNTCYGHHAFSVSLRKSDFIQWFWAAIGISIVVSSAAMFVMLLLSVAAGALGSLGGQGGAGVVGIVVGYLLLGLSMSFAFAFWQAKVFNAQFANLGLDHIRFKSDLKIVPLSMLMITNSLMVIFTIGLAYPWAVVRMLRFKLDAVSYQGDPNQFSGSAAVAESAVGDEVGQAFDLDFGFG